MAEANETLFPEFPPVSAQQWTDKITADLKGVPFGKKMIWKTGEGFDVNPFYCAEDLEGLPVSASLPGEFPYVRGIKSSNSWLVRQDINVADCRSANEKARRLVAGSGVTSIGFHLKGDDVNEANIARLLDGICPETTELNFKTCNRKAAELTGLLARRLEANGADAAKCRGSVAYNPYKRALKDGRKLGDNWVSEALAVVEAGVALPEGYRVLAVDACLLNDAGAYITQELGYALAWGSDLIAKLSEAGWQADAVAKKIKFNFGISSDYFMEIAKFRAARRLWAEIVKAWLPERRNAESACEMHAHARTSAWNQTVFDAYVNMLRTQTETMSAALAGVESITVSAYDEAFRTPDDFSERIARNQQLLLKEECHFDKVADPAAGSYYIETLTQSLADAAWQRFMETEDGGGFAEAVNRGEIQQAVNESNSARRKMVATRRLSLLGTNQYPNFTETAGDKIETRAGGCDCGCGEGEDDSLVARLDFSRGASDFEALRLSTERHGRRPKVFMLTIGNLAMRLARSQFASNFFACAGYELIDNLGFETVAKGVEAARQKQADIIVLCSSDEEYAAFAPEAFRLIGGDALLVVAGAPACMDDLKAAGINCYINVKSNVLETLRMFNQKMNTGE
jgi:methylmalonyl-CoA mutase